MIFKIILGCLMIFYSIVSLFAFLTNKEIKTSLYRVALGVVSCVLIFVSMAGLIIHKDFFAWMLLLGLVLLQIIALMNGYTLHKRPNWLHHIIRMIFSIFIIWSYIKYA